MSKRSPIERDHVREWEEIAGFGAAKIMKDLQGRFAIHGGTAEDRQKAIDWAERFLSPVRWHRK